MLDSDRDSHRRGDSNGGSAANNHGFDGVGDVAVIRVGVVDDFAREAKLIEDYDAF